MASSSTITTKSLKKNQELQHCHEFPNLFFSFWSLTLVGEEASMLTIMHGVENLGSRFSSMPLLNDLDVFCIKPMARRIDVLQCNRWGNVEFLKHYKCN